MKNLIVAFLVGVLFSLGLGISGMVQPEKVIGFLDIFGAWDPSLMFVMLGAIGVHAVAYRFILKKTRPVFAEKFQIPQKKEITKSLIFGSIIFGLGWGLAGYCPGPAVTSLASSDVRPLVFVICMLVGMLIFRMIPKGSA